MDDTSLLSSSGSSGSEFSGPTARAGLIALGLGAFGIGLTEFVIMGLLPEVAGTLGVTISAAGLLITAYAIGVTVGGPILLILLRRMPLNRVLMTLMLIFIAGNIACALAPSYSFMVGARALTGVTHGLYFGVGAIVAQDLVAPDRRSSAIAMLFAGLTLANVLGVPLGTWIGQWAGWRATFWLVAGSGIVAGVAMLAFLPGSGGGRVRSSWRDLAVVARPATALALAMTVLGYAGVFLLFTYISPTLTQVSGFSAEWISPLMLLFGVGLVGGNLAGGRLADRDLRASLLGTLAALTICLVVMGAALSSRWGAAAALVAFGATAFATVAPLQSWTLLQAPQTGSAMASTLNISAFNLGNALGACIGSLLVSWPAFGLRTLPLAAALLPAAAFAIAWFAVRARSNHLQGEPS